MENNNEIKICWEKEALYRIEHQKDLRLTWIVTNLEYCCCKEK